MKDSLRQQFERLALRLHRAVELVAEVIKAADQRRRDPLGLRHAAH
jgi:hypothetical protein